MIYWTDAYNNLSNYLRENGYKRPLVVCDENTYDVCGKKITEYLDDIKYDYKVFYFSKDVVADEYAIGRLVFEYDNNDLMIAVGSGTITDIVRFSSYRLNVPFVVFPTAASMDGFTSSVCAMTIDNLKTTVIAIPPQAMFIEMDIIENSPEILKRAGFGDLMGKITALLDWQLSHILFNEHIDFDVMSIVKNTYLKTLHSVGMNDFSKNLLEGLIMSGQMMAKVGSSRPASGAEHHVSHFLEYHRIKTYHGIKVGVATLYILEFYRHFLNLSPKRIKDRLYYNMDVVEWENQVKKYFIYTYTQVINNNRKRIQNINDKGFRTTFIRKLIEKKNMLNNMISGELNIYDDLLSSYKKLGLPLSYKDIPVDEELFKMAFVCAPNIRERFTILHLYQILGLTNEVIDILV